MIIGEQGSGKSSLLNHLLYKLDDDENTLLIKLSALNLENFNQQNFLKHVVEILREESKQYRSKSGKILDGFLKTMTDCYFCGKELLEGKTYCASCDHEIPLRSKRQIHHNKD